MTTATHALTLPGRGRVAVTADDQGEGRPFLLLHGGGGPQTVAGFAELLATRGPARVITPAHPGFGGTPRPDWLDTMAGLAAVYRELLERLGLQVFPLGMDELARLSYHDPAAFRIDPAAMTEAQRAGMAANRAALQTYGGARMADPGLHGRLAAIACPTLVIWGEADRIADPGYGRGYAAAIPGARFELLPGTGHLPQLETPEQLMPAVWDFFAEAPAAR